MTVTLATAVTPFVPSAMSTPVVAIVFAAPMAVVIVPAAVVAPAWALVWMPAPWWRLLHKIHGLIAGVVPGAVLAPVLGVAWRHIQINGRTRHHDSRALDDDGLGIDQRRRWRIADVDAAIDAGRQFPPPVALT